MQISWADTWRCSIKIVFLKISQNSQEKPVPESVFNTVAGLISSYEVISPNQETISSCVA